MDDLKASCVIKDGDLYMCGNHITPFQKVDLEKKVRVVKIGYNLTRPIVFFIDEDGALWGFYMNQFSATTKLKISLITNEYFIKDFCYTQRRVIILTNDNKIIFSGTKELRNARIFMPLENAPPMIAISTNGRCLYALDINGNIWGNDLARESFLHFRSHDSTDKPYVLYQLTKDIVFIDIYCANVPHKPKFVAFDSEDMMYSNIEEFMTNKRTGNIFNKITPENLKFKYASIGIFDDFFIDYDNNLWQFTGDRDYDSWQLTGGRFVFVLPNVSQIDTEIGYSFVLLEDGTLMAKGNNDTGALGRPKRNRNEDENEYENEFFYDEVENFEVVRDIQPNQLVGFSNDTRFKKTKSANNRQQ